ncbi:MAG: TrkH family potassium uptake protein [Enterovibrio sp.]
MINVKAIYFVIGLILSKIAVFMYIPTITALLTGTSGFFEFALSVVITHLVAVGCIAYGKTEHFQLKIREMFVITTLVWLICCVFAALPFIFINDISFTDAYFETMSGVTTTGSTVLSGLDNMAPAILLWRSILQWLGGVGFIVMSVAILPFLNVGGMRLFHTESSDWSAKESPRTQTVASGIMLVYTILTALCAFAYWCAGMSPFEAINHSMTTLSTAGYSTSDNSMNNFSHAAHWVGSFFMFAGALPFLLLKQIVKRRSFSVLIKDAQVRGFTILVLTSALATAAWLVVTKDYSVLDSLRVSIFNVISVITTTGFGLDDFSAWGPFATVIFIFLLLAGGCSGSSSGGAKIFRFQIAFALLSKQIKQLIQPSGVFIQRYNGKEISDDIVRSVVAFAITYLFSMLLLAIVLAATGLDTTTSLTGAITAVANVGPGMGAQIGPTGNFAGLSDVAKWALSIGMLMGRLEILTVLVLLIPRFWRS